MHLQVPQHLRLPLHPWPNFKVEDLSPIHVRKLSATDGTYVSKYWWNQGLALIQGPNLQPWISQDLTHCLYTESAAVLIGNPISYHGKVLDAEGIECIVSFPGYLVKHDGDGFHGFHGESGRPKSQTMPGEKSLPFVWRSNVFKSPMLFEIFYLHLRVFDKKTQQYTRLEIIWRRIRLLFHSVQPVSLQNHNNNQELVEIDHWSTEANMQKCFCKTPFHVISVWLVCPSCRCLTDRSWRFLSGR